MLITKNKYLWSSSILLCLLTATGLAEAASPNPIRPGFNATALPANDDKSSGLEPIGFEVNFFGETHNNVYVNNNGNVTFTEPLNEYTPFPLLTTQKAIIAAFFADVDTRKGAVARYGNSSVNGRPAFGVTWPNVGCYLRNTSVSNSFQLILIDRADIANGDFDIEFNYQKIEWETGTHSNSGGDENCLGGNSVRVGFSNGNGLPGEAFELLGSGVNGAFLDNNSATGLIHNSLNSNQLGRYIFEVRNGVVEINHPPVANAGPDQTVEFTTGGARVPLNGSGSTDPDVDDNLTYNWAGSFVGGAASGINPMVTFDTLGVHTVTLSVSDGEATSTDTVDIKVVDTTAPLLSLPLDITVECTTADGVSISDPAIKAFLAAATAVDAVDPKPSITHDAPGSCKLGDTKVTFTASDVSGNSSSGSAVIKIVDTTGPNITAALVPIRNCDDDDEDCDRDDENDDCDDDEQMFIVEYSCGDTCSAATNISSALLNGIPVSNGQRVSLERDDDTDVEYDDGILEIEAPSFSLDVTCADGSGNRLTVAVTPKFQCRQDFTALEIGTLVCGVQRHPVINWLPLLSKKTVHLVSKTWRGEYQLLQHL